MSDIYSLFAINKKAALVVSQSGCMSHEGLSHKQERANLCSKLLKLKEKIATIKKSDPIRKSYGIEIKETQDKIIEINKHIKRYAKKQDLSHYIIAIIKEKMTKTQWETLVYKAIEIKKRDDCMLD